MFQDVIAPAVLQMSREQFNEWQFKALQDALKYAYNSSSFYRKRLDETGAQPDKIKTPEDFAAKVPFTDKKTFLADQQDNPPYGNRLCVPPSEVVEVRSTSGTSGIGQETYALTDQDRAWSGRGWATHFLEQGMVPGDITLLTLPVSNLSASHDIINAIRLLKLNCFFMGTYDTDTKMRYMANFPVRQLIATPSYLIRLALTYQEKGLDPKKMHKLKGITLLGEPWPEKWALDMQEFWGCPIHEMYGSTQSGNLLATTCHPGGAMRGPGKRGSLHFMEHLCYIEMLDPVTDKPVAYGEDGELVVTRLFSQAVPVLRFRTSDKMQLHKYDTCDCGNILDYIPAGSVSRWDDMIKIKAMNVWPSAVDTCVFAFDEVDEYQALVSVDAEGKEGVAISIDFKKGVSADRKKEVLKAMADDIRANTKVAMKPVEVPEGSLPKFQGKARRWTDTRHAGMDKMGAGKK